MPDDLNPPRDQFDHEELASYLSASETSAELGFDEDTYLRAFSDVADAVERGDLTSGLEHYLRAGRAERRLQRPEYFRQIARDRTAASVPMPTSPRAEIDALIVSESGAVFIVGWTADQQNPLVSVSVGASRAARRVWTEFPRLRRSDVDNAVPSVGHYQYGFWVFGGSEDPRRRHGISPGVECRIELRFASGAVAEVQRVPALFTDSELRDHVMSYFAASEYWGNRSVEAFTSLDQGVGEPLVEFGRTLSRAVTARATAERFGPRRKRFKGSIIVPLFGIIDYLFLQAGAYAPGPGIEDYEFIYVLNSPEMIERLQRETRIAQTIYGLSQTLVFMPGNAGFGPANNVALQFAQSDRVLCVNPDVFPQDPNWAQRHNELIASLPAHQTRLFGTTLYYDDGSLMHGGMYFDMDTGIHAAPAGITQRKLVRVEHYGKGAPSWAAEYATARPVPAVTGAFMSIDRAWFEKLGGFSEDYMFGSYEDADLCLKSLQAGVPVWLHDIRMWHLEGKGSRRLPQHDGGTLLNRWLFSRRWEAMLVPDLLGRNPRHSLLREGAETPPPALAPRAIQRKPVEVAAPPERRATDRPSKARKL